VILVLIIVYSACACIQAQMFSWLIYCMFCILLYIYQNMYVCQYVPTVGRDLTLENSY